MTRKILKWFCLSTVLVLSACLLESRHAGRGSVVDNEVGYLYRADGGPAARANITVLALRHIPDSTEPVYVTKTDENGRYRLKSIKVGRYNILGELNGEVAFQDSVPVFDNGVGLPPDTLESPGSLTGWVSVEPNHDPRTATVQVLGTNSHANVDATGLFRLDGLPSGSYPVRIVTTLPDYTPLYVTLQIASGSKDTLSDTLKLPFTGIPVVSGLKAVYDTVTGVVGLTWRSTEYRNFSDYLVYRDTAGSPSLSSFPIGITADTSYLDTIRLPHGKGLYEARDTSSHGLEYRVRIRNESDEAGPTYGKAEVSAAPLRSVMPRIQMHILSVVWNAEKQADSIVAIAEVDAPTRPQTEIVWLVGDSEFRSEGVSGLAFTDTLRFHWGSEGSFRLGVRVRDEAGTLWTHDSVLAGNSAPKISGSPATAAKTGETYSFYPEVEDSDGDRLEFQATDLPGWLVLDPEKGALHGVPGTSDTGTYQGISIRVTDGRRFSVLGPFSITVEGNPWEKGADLPENWNSMAVLALRERIFLVSASPEAYGRYRVDEYSPESESWVSSLPVPSGWILARGGGTFEGKIILFGNKEGSGSRDVFAIELDPDSGTWRERSSTPAIQEDFGKVWTSGQVSETFLVFISPMFDEYSVLEYEPSTEQWTVSDPVPEQYAGAYQNLSAGANGVYFNRSYNGRIGHYAQGDNVWSQVPLSDRGYDWWDMALCGGGDGFYAVGGSNGQDSGDIDYMRGAWTRSFSSESGAWKIRSDIPVPGPGYVCLEVGESIYVFGGPQGKVFKYQPWFER